MNSLTIRIKKVGDGPAVLACVRADGSVTKHSLHDIFPVHDLTHYAVETELGYTRGFFGIVAEGWDLKDFGAPWPRGPLPSETALVETVVSVFWRKHLMREPEDAGALNAELAAMPLPPDQALPTFTQEQVSRVRTRIGTLTHTWAALPVGEYLELRFPPPPLSDP